MEVSGQFTNEDQRQVAVTQGNGNKVRRQAQKGGNKRRRG